MINWFIELFHIHQWTKWASLKDVMAIKKDAAKNVVESTGNRGNSDE